MGATSFKDLVAADISAVFLNGQEFADTHTIDGKPMTVVVDENQYVQRWTTTLHITYTHVVKLDVESTDAVNVGVHNVDVRFPPR